MTVAEEVEYFRRRAESGALGSWWKRVLPAGAEGGVVREKRARYVTKRKRR